MALNSRELTALSTEKSYYRSAKRYEGGGFKKRSLKIDKPLAQTILVLKARCTKVTIVMLRTHKILDIIRYINSYINSYIKKLLLNLCF